MFQNRTQIVKNKIINFEKKKIKSLTKQQQESYENEKICFICKQKFENKYLKDKKHLKVKDHYYNTGEYRSTAHNIQNFKNSVPLACHNGSNYEYHFIIRELAEEFKK